LLRSYTKNRADPLAIEVIADKWSVVTLFALSDGPRHHGDLVTLIGGISRKVLT
jgi:DNA-binding HxlR family transcriptional regulator